ncbi:hypothetical protein [Deinococcus multiflagellatus]|uniref:MFS transporter n=1 Tax=Deinococcus multiflagellatus TaxID=1656887 RepID=A0ABW1ZQS0_9DEIO|nr:hypothetical protein [Deinococcus multiflagellatus]MBZ9715823.1 hypothetical protein [Deinococcus multiflagellatus]
MMTLALSAPGVVSTAPTNSYLASELKIAGNVVAAGAGSVALGLLALTVAPCAAAVSLGTLALFAVLSVPAFRR